MIFVPFLGFRPELRNPATMFCGRNRQFQSPVHFLAQQPPQPQQQQVAQPKQSVADQQVAPIGDFLRADFVMAADEWFSHVINETRGSPEMSHSIRKYQFRLDCDSAARKVDQNIRYSDSKSFEFRIFVGVYPSNVSYGS